MPQKLCVVGLGYVGVVTASCFARLGHMVIGVDNNPQRVELLSMGRLPFFEPGLDELLKEGLAKGNLSFSSDIDHAIRESKIVFICVGTPADENGQADLGQVEEVSRCIARNLNEYKLIVEKSTVPAGTAGKISQAIKLVNLNGSHAFDMASNPEFLREGSAVSDFMAPDRVILGVESRRAAELARELYRDYDCPVLITDIATAELTKHASNAFLAMKISFANLMADICEKVGADIRMLADGMGYDKRIGREFLNAGAGYGGSCFPKDIKAFAALAGNLGIDPNLLQEIDRINERRIYSIVRKLEDALWVCRNKRIAVLGLAFKCNTDDVRESPGLKLIKQLAAKGSQIVCYDPRAMDNARNELNSLGIQVAFVENRSEERRVG